MNVAQLFLPPSVSGSEDDDDVDSNSDSERDDGALADVTDEPRGEELFWQVLPFVTVWLREERPYRVAAAVRDRHVLTNAFFVWMNVTQIFPPPLIEHESEDYDDTDYTDSSFDPERDYGTDEPEVDDWAVYHHRVALRSWWRRMHELNLVEARPRRARQISMIEADTAVNASQRRRVLG